MDMRSNKGQFTKGQHWRKRQPWWDKAWLYDQYVSCGRSGKDIAFEGGVTENAIYFWLAKHKIKCRGMRAIRKRKHWGSCGSDNPMWNRRGELNPRWLGGVTPERQAYYSGDEWKRVCAYVWKRDGAACRRCGLCKNDSHDMPFHIHHIVSFANKALRSAPFNLVLLCEVCHHFVHSKRNTQRDYLPQI